MLHEFRLPKIFEDSLMDRGFNIASESSKDKKLREMGDVSCLEEVKYIRKNGSVAIVKPKLIASLIREAVLFITSSPKTSFMRHYLNKPVILSFEVGTACTDGRSIQFNPFFAKLLIAKCNADTKAFELSTSTTSGQASAVSKFTSDYGVTGVPITTIRNVTNLRLLMFVIIHEVYHKMYRHIRRANIKLGKLTNANHKLTNIAMDMEINRDIEYQFPVFSGCTKTLYGVWYEEDQYINKETNKPFEMQTWETIYDYFEKHPDLLKQRAAMHTMKNPTFKPKPKGAKQTSQEKYGENYVNGWKQAMEAIKNGLLGECNIDF